MKDSDMTASSSGGVPPGFRFHPTDEELLQYYLKKKVSFQEFDMEVMLEVDLNKMEPWDLQERCRIGSTPQNEWYFFSHKDRKYPTGSRTNRATNAGFWKATGRDKCIRNSFKKIGMRKTLVFYRGRAPHGQKTDWIMHEYRLEDADDDNLANPSEDGWVVCRVFKKKNFFKIGNEGGATSPNSDQQQLSINHVNANQHQPRPSLHRDNLYLLRHQPTNFDVVEPELALQYSSHSHSHSHSHGGLHPPPQYSLFPSHQALIPNHKPLGYDYSPPLQSAPLKHLMSSATGDQCDSGGSDGFRYPQNGEQAGLEVGTGLTQHQQMVGGRGDQTRMSEWGMLSHLGNDHSSKGVARFEDAASTSSVHINPLSLRGEMDFWGYGK